MKSIKKLKGGQTLIAAVVFMAVVLILTSSLFDRTSEIVKLVSSSSGQEQANSLAEAGVDRALWQLNKTAGSYTGESNTSIGTTGTFTVTLTNKYSNTKTITSTGYVPSSANPTSQRTVKVDVAINTTIVAFNYAVQVGIGGISLGQSAVINGSVYSNKSGANSISGNNGSIITGDAWMVGTISPSNPTVLGNLHQNQQPSQMPQFDPTPWINTATAGGTINCSSTPALCNLSGSGPYYIGNKEYIGSITLGQGTQVIINGPVYITGPGNLTLGQSSSLSLDNSFGSNGTALIIDGTLNIGQGASINPTNASPKGYIIIDTTSTSGSAVSIGQSAANAIIYALSGGIQLGQSAHATAVIGKQLTLGQSATLTYDQGLASSDFSSGPGASWQPIKGTYHYSQ